eukprot:SAG22_NODE_1002_length_6052_cov_3.257558_2_plen_66_part_00
MPPRRARSRGRGQRGAELLRPRADQSRRLRLQRPAAQELPAGLQVSRRAQARGAQGTRSGRQRWR